MYQVREEVNANGFHVIEITEGEFTGTTFSYSKISFEEVDDGGAVLHFDYNVVGSEISESKKSEFEKLLGDLLLGMLEKQLDNNEVVYSGGSDESKGD